MGEVYRAKDPRLGREVAIKVLPASFSADAERLRRFEQEARAAGILNHPNITAVHDVGTHEGAPYVVSELLEGETLRSALAGGKLSQKRSIDYALQIAHGLAAAHEKGIVHRDLKPENLFVTRDGRVKILDFGLAKLTHTEAGPEVTSLPTATAGTEPGVVLGTLGYMSPEQVRGKPSDARSDIFSFGAILYEMLSGKRAFHGDSAADTMSAILKEDPPDLSVTNQSISPGLERIVRHCIEKNPEQRFHSAHDLAFDLEALSGVSSAAGAPAKDSSVRRSLRLPFLAGVTLAVAGIAAAYVAGKKAGYVPPPSFRQLTFRRGAIASARFAPDGQTILYSARWEGSPIEIFVSRLDTPESRAFGLPEAEVLSISPSGEMAVSLARLSPRGDEIAFLDHPVVGDDSGSVAIVDLEGKHKSISGSFSSIQGLCWSPGGREVWFTGASVGFNRALHAATRAGRVRLLSQGTGGLTIQDVSRGGRVLVVQDKARMEISALAPGGEKERNLSWLDWSLVRDLSRDGQTLLFDETGEGGGSGYSVYVRKTDGSPAVRLGEGAGAALSPDGRLALSLVGPVSSPTMVLYPVGTGDTKSLPAAGLRIRDVSWFPDGRRILISANEADHGLRLWVQALDGGKPRAISPEGYEGFLHSISPDGKSAAVTGPDRRFYLYPVEGGEPTPLPGLLVGDIPCGWSADGHSLFVRRRGELPARILLVDTRSGRRQIWKELKPTDPAGVTTAGSTAVTPDGRSYAYSYSRSLADLYVVEGVK